ncbi:hypothetical protein [Saccharopolyspora sp. 6V]|uniref:hypothetical protein n=1 Tax=Saccharopolyspora sp. 6V TaxID=2877239 RepID=UPI001CD7BDEF|nr:hypothetical protein [Saccharopolyspora sp. 6V]MCA1194502.1 hypothetical protein [Saccharopolyspora sp. 6V]
MTEFSGLYPPRAGGFVVCLECAFVSGIAEWAAAFVPDTLSGRIAEVSVISEPTPPRAVRAGPWNPVPGRHSVDAPTGEIRRIRPHTTTKPSCPRSNAGVEAPGSWYLPGTSTPGNQGIASAA